MSERGGLAAFWFPTSIWMIALLDGASDAAFAGTESWVLLSALVALFVAFLGARELRRIALWQTHATRRLSVLRPSALLRRSPSRTGAQAAWFAGTAGATLLLAAWVAPHLWQTDEAERQAIFLSQQQAGAANPGSGIPCCPEAQDFEVESHRIREYLPLLKPHEDAAHPGPLARCVACRDGVAIGASPLELSPLVAGAAASGATGSQSSGAAMGDAATAPASGAFWPPPAPSFAPRPPSEQPAGFNPAAQPTTPIAPASSHGPVAAPPGIARSVDVHPVQWLLALAACGLLVQLLLRPLRRLVTLWHLRESIWPEPADQRVSNLWQLVLVGLRDAGWRVAPGEQPRELARRVDLPGAEVCSEVLERTRHGARVDATDLESMKRAASAVYRDSRMRVGRLARALSWLRWPLV
jgi:hypothetical protein